MYDPKPGVHTFLLQGSGTKYNLVHTPTIHMASGRAQIILSANIEGDVPSAKHANEKTQALIVHNAEPLLLDDIVDGRSFEGTLTVGSRYACNSPVSSTLFSYALRFRRTAHKVNISNIKVIKKRSLATKHLAASYPSLMPFYLYGTQDHPHLDHVITALPNIHLSAGEIHCNFEPKLTNEDFEKGLIAIANSVHESVMQPFPLMKDFNISQNFFFNTGNTLHVTVYRDPYPASTTSRTPISEVKEVVTKGTITLNGNLYVDTDALNAASERSVQLLPSVRTRDGKLTHGTLKSWSSAARHIHNKMTTAAPTK